MVSPELARVSDNRNKLDAAMLELADTMRLPVAGGTRYAVEQELWSLDDLSSEVRRNVG